jgi:hypothetical protein
MHCRVAGEPCFLECSKIECLSHICPGRMYLHQAGVADVHENLSASPQDDYTILPLQSLHRLVVAGVPYGLRLLDGSRLRARQVRLQ